MESLQVQNYGCQEMNAADVKDVNGGFFLFSLTNVGGKITVGAQLDTNALTSGLPIPGIGGGTGGLGNLLSPVTNLLNSLLGGLGGGLLGA